MKVKMERIAFLFGAKFFLKPKNQKNVLFCICVDKERNASQALACCPHGKETFQESNHRNKYQAVSR